MTADELAMLEFAAKWYRFGGGDEFIFPEFGVTPAVFYQRVLRLVESTTSNIVTPQTRIRLRQFCTGKLSRAAQVSAVSLPSAAPQPQT
ncbi:DUF3263 domain-containing protein [Nocardia vaccinii]|uniref:DUF3263 domain-containing protein n=1 Tax=Nocardia vaccinii TaxID=1822 RepID=UPI000835925B|nr:DUF3263 domain-containing protein [Nocardia vaccinii]